MGVLRTILLRLIRDEIAKHRHMDVHQYGSAAGPKSTVVFDKIDAAEKCEVMDGEQELVVPSVPLHGAPVSSRETAGVSGVQGRHGVLDVADDSSGKDSVARRREEAPVKPAPDAANGPQWGVWCEPLNGHGGGWTRGGWTRSGDDVFSNEAEAKRQAEAFRKHRSDTATYTARPYVGSTDTAAKEPPETMLTGWSERLGWCALGTTGTRQYELVRADVSEKRVEEANEKYELLRAHVGARPDESTADALDRVVAERDEARARMAAAERERGRDNDAWARRFTALHEILGLSQAESAENAARRVVASLAASEARVRELEAEHRAALEALGPIGGTGLVGMVLATRARAATAEGECGRLEKDLDESKREYRFRVLECETAHVDRRDADDLLVQLQAQHEADAKEMAEAREDRDCLVARVQRLGSASKPTSEELAALRRGGFPPHSANACRDVLRDENERLRAVLERVAAEPCAMRGKCSGLCRCVPCEARAALAPRGKEDSE